MVGYLGWVVGWEEKRMEGKGREGKTRCCCGGRKGAERRRGGNRAGAASAAA